MTESGFPIEYILKYMPLAYMKGGKNRHYTYVRLVEPYLAKKGKIRHKVIKNFGRMDRLLAEDPQAIEKIQLQ